MLRLAFLGALAPVLAGVIAACAQPPVRWGESTTLPPAPDGDVRLAVDGAGRVYWRPASSPPPEAAVGGNVCPGSLRTAHAGERHVYAVWWAPRPDSTAALLAARSTDGGATWSEVAPVDTADRGRTGCRRPAASIAADSAKGYVHVAYSMVAPGAPGVFFSHSMPGPLLFHAPVPIIYGERIGGTSVAASGDVVAVAYEDPNGVDRRVGLALSRTLGHTFDHRIAVSTGVGAAVEPTVALRGANVAVAWRQRRGVRTMASEGPREPAPIVVRLGELAGP